MPAAEAGVSGRRWSAAQLSSALLAGPNAGRQARGGKRSRQELAEQDVRKSMCGGERRGLEGESQSHSGSH